MNAERFNTKNPLDILASKAIKSERMQLTFPNRCSSKGCSAPLHLVPEQCSSCLRLVHPILCQKFMVGLGVNFSKLLCPVCHEEEAAYAPGPINFIELTTAAQVTTSGSNDSIKDSTAFPAKSSQGWLWSPSWRCQCGPMNC